MDIISQLSAAVEFDFGLDLLNWEYLSQQKFKDPSIILKHPDNWNFNMLSKNTRLSEFIKNNTELRWNHSYICLFQPLDVIEALNINLNANLSSITQSKFLTQDFILAHPEVNWRTGTIFSHMKFDIEFMKKYVPLDRKELWSLVRNPHITIDLLEQIVETYPNMGFKLDAFAIVTPKLLFKNGQNNNCFHDYAVQNIMVSPNFNTNEAYQYLQMAATQRSNLSSYIISNSPKFNLQFALEHPEFPHWNLTVLMKRYEKETGKKVKLTPDGDTVVVIDQHKKLLRVQTQDGKPAPHRLRVQIDPQQLQGETTIDIDMDDVVVV